MTVVAAKWTLEEYHQMIASGVLDNRRVELIRGEIIEIAPEGQPNAYSVSESGEYMSQLLGEKAKIRYGHPITLPNQSEPEPDIAVVRRLGAEYFSHHPYPENIFWLIEHSNTSLDKDLNLKSCAYAEAKIKEYWIVNIPAASLIVFREPLNGQYQTQSTYTGGSIRALAIPKNPNSVSTIISQL